MAPRSQTPHLRCEIAGRLTAHVRRKPQKVHQANASLRLMQLKSRNGQSPVCLGLREREKGFEVYQGEINPKQHARLPPIALIFFEPHPATYRPVPFCTASNRARTSIRRQLIHRSAEPHRYWDHLRWVSSVALGTFIACMVRP